jgi:class 3 adenylate cyclase
MAACGLPETRDDHALVMAKFARECLYRYPKILREMSEHLGPSVRQLGLRTGLHSGSVTAGVLRGEKSRFQLFGDTVNTASRMESTGITNRIQISRPTMKLLMASGKCHDWIQPRETTVTAKGKGEMQTYWLLSRSEQNALVAVEENNYSEDDGESQLSSTGVTVASA